MSHHLTFALFPLRLPLTRAIRTAQGEIREVNGLRLSVRGGRFCGWGEAVPISGRTESLERVQLLLTMEARRGCEVPDTLERVASIVGRLPADAPAARFALELALLDWMAQERRIPLAQLLSPRPRRQVRVSAFLQGEKPEEVSEAATRARDAGFDTVKLKVASHALSRDVARVAAVCRSFPKARVRVDANGGWSEGLARSAVAELGGLSVELCEQPVPAEEVEALERIAQLKGGCPVAADEATPRLIARGTPTPVRIWVLKPVVLGGLLACLKAADHARPLGVECVVSTGWEGRVARLGALHLVAVLPGADRAHGLGTGAYLGGPEAGPHPEAGQLRVPASPGLGLGGTA
jgi:L-alanine-DL-glutamate epimerase-like enolase superfamily enzyme